MMPSITCHYCGGNRFTLVIALTGKTYLQCVNHQQHVQDLDIEGQRKRFEEERMREFERKRQEEERRERGENVHRLT